MFKEKSTTLEVAFPGAHADVGGGYDDKNNQLPDISLNWMVSLLSPQPYKFSPETHDFINKTNADPKGLAHLPISDPDGNSFSSCLDRKLPDSISKHQSITDRDNSGSVPWLVVEKNSSSNNPVHSCIEWVKPIKGVKQEQIECIRQANIMCKDLKLNGWIK